MTSFRFLLMTGALAAFFGVVPPAAAQDSLASPNFKPAAKPKPTKAASATNKERRPGELEGFDSGMAGPVKAKGRRPPDAIGERVLPDGGLPLPNQRDSSPGMGQAPVGFDKSGNIGGMFKF